MFWEYTGGGAYEHRKVTLSLTVENMTFACQSQGHNCKHKCLKGCGHKDVSLRDTPINFLILSEMLYKCHNLLNVILNEKAIYFLLR